MQNKMEQFLIFSIVILIFRENSEIIMKIKCRLVIFSGGYSEKLFVTL